MSPVGLKLPEVKMLKSISKAVGKGWWRNHPKLQNTSGLKPEKENSLLTVQECWNSALLEKQTEM